MLTFVVLTGSCIRVISRDERSREVARGYEILRVKVARARESDVTPRANQTTRCRQTEWLFSCLPPFETMG